MVDSVYPSPGDVGIVLGVPAAGEAPGVFMRLIAWTAGLGRRSAVIQVTVGNDCQSLVVHD